MGSNQRTCSKGHIYDASLYASCPYCNGMAKNTVFGMQESSSMGGGRTVAPGMMGGLAQDFSSGRTVAPGMVGVPVQGNGRNPEDIGKTVAPQEYVDRQKREGRTRAYFDLDPDDTNRHRNLPVVGWLVCIEGPDKGESFQLRAKNNLIGRGTDVDVRLNDETVSREQARIGYDPKHNDFRLIPGDSTNLSYLNDEPVYIPMKLSAYDLIEIGNIKLLFVPFCGEQFQWGQSTENKE